MVARETATRSASRTNAVPITIPGDAGTPRRSSSSLGRGVPLGVPADGWLFLFVLLRDIVDRFLTGKREAVFFAASRRRV